MARPLRSCSANFYPRPPWGGRQADRSWCTSSREFLSTPSVGRATPDPGSSSYADEDFYPRPPWGGRPVKEVVPMSAQKISIHALRGEGDCRRAGAGDRRQGISIHALRGEGDPLR